MLQNNIIKKQEFNFVHLLRAFAALLIINSHSDKLFPNDLSFLGTGGSLGNAIFFFTSGCTLALGLQKTNQSYLRWLKRRIFRLYPSNLIFMLFSVFFLYTSYQWYDWLFFDGSWFLQAILLYYVLFFPVIRFGEKYLFLILISIYTLFVIFFILSNNSSEWVVDLMDNPTRIHWIYYFLVMLLGALVVVNRSCRVLFDKLIVVLKYKYILILLFVAIIIFYIPKLLVVKMGFDSYLQLIYPLLLLLTISLFYLCSLESAIRINSAITKKVIIFISNLTLDIYIVHFAIIHYIISLNLFFPLNYTLALFLILICALCLKKIVDKLLKLVGN